VSGGAFYCWGRRRPSWFLRQYVYIPLGGNRQGAPRQLANLFTTMVIAGIWHGAGWTFVLFGTLHGAALVMQTAARMLGVAIGGVVGWALTFMTVIVGWVFFRAETVAGALSMLSAMFDMKGLRLSASSGFVDLVPTAWTIPGLIAAGLFVVLSMPNTTEIFEPWRLEKIGLGRGGLSFSWRPTMAWAALASAVAIACLIRMQTYSEFLYFNF
jgi:alginate O-acetyltransferase complex protein AlgI